MKKEDIQIGMKVVPHSKTVKGWGDLEESSIWSWAKEKFQDYLYITYYYKDEDYYVLSLNKDDLDENGEGEGDFFNAEDFELFKEDIK